MVQTFSFNISVLLHFPPMGGKNHTSRSGALKKLEANKNLRQDRIKRKYEKHVARKEAEGRGEVVPRGHTKTVENMADYGGCSLHLPSEDEDWERFEEVIALNYTLFECTLNTLFTLFRVRFPIFSLRLECSVIFSPRLECDFRLLLTI